MNFITKPSIVITSLGRTGTRFFSFFFRELFVDVTSLHEPDILNFSPKLSKGFALLRDQITEAGFWNIIVRRIFQQWNLAILSDKRMIGTVNTYQAVEMLKKQRRDFVLSRPGKIYVESSVGFYGLVDLLLYVFERHRVIFLLRDGREWVRSVMEWGDEGKGMYSKGKLRSLIAHRWPTADDFPGDPYFGQWSTMDRFERVCWAWSKLNEFALQCVSKNPNVLVLRFEDVFNPEADGLRELVRFMLDILKKEEQSRLIRNINYDNMLGKKIHSSAHVFPGYEEWTESQKMIFWKHCGQLMQAYYPEVR